MKITPISYNYNKYNVKKNYCITPSFQAKVVVPKISIAEINDRSVGSMQNRLSKMLQFSIANSSKQKESFVRRTTSSVKNFFAKEKSKLREDYNSLKRDSEEKDFLLLTLIIFSFNNQIRFNSNGEFNMPVGKRDFNSSSRKNIKDFALKIKNKTILFQNKDFNKIDYSNLENPFFYCDPPYYLGIASYNENNGWTIKEERKLLKFLEKLNEEGNTIVLITFYHK